MLSAKSLLFILLVGCASVWSRRISGYEPDDFTNEDNNDESDRPRQLHRSSFPSEPDENPIEHESQNSYHRLRKPDRKYSEESDESEPESRGAYDKQESEERSFRNHLHRPYPHHLRRFDRTKHEQFAGSNRRSENYMRRETYLDTDDLLTRLYETLQDLSKSLREQNRFPRPPPPPPPPQIIYIPYPIQMSPSCSCRKQPSQNTSVPSSVDNRFFEDMRQNWGIADSPDYDNTQYKPLSFDSVAKHQTTDDLSHIQHKDSTSSSKRESPDTALSPPTICDIAVLSCCQQNSASEMSKCLEMRDCAENVDCSKTHIKDILQKAERFYVNS